MVSSLVILISYFLPPPLFGAGGGGGGGVLTFVGCLWLLMMSPVGCLTIFVGL
ncbi:hypothetical protein [Gilliamella apis]|uniref:hypothetical protein n=1 Tax=Gilliamella apis TaxID=1970738 RepID=UPI0013F4E019|nr:hypothetical protein [Gilliamella apis]